MVADVPDIDGPERPAIEIHVHVHHHFDGKPLTVLLGEARPPATKAVLTVGEAPPMSTATLTVDTVNAQANLAYVDDKGDTNAPKPDVAVATFSSDNEAALTIDPTSGAITVVGEGVANVAVRLADASGNPLVEVDGTPWQAVLPVAVTVNPGAAVGAQLTV
jgi:hypothetical protein